jgi:hypothetical protein
MMRRRSDSTMLGKTSGRPRFRVAAALAYGCLSVACTDRLPEPAHATPAAVPALADGLGPARLERLVARNLQPAVSLPESLLDERIAAWAAAPIGTRIVRWAELFLERGDAHYVFGLAAGGYVSDSLLVQDFKTDCVLLTYRCTELARATSARDAIVRALDSRFHGGSPSAVVSSTGGVNYDDPAHLDYSEDAVRAGRLWGRDVTQEVGLAAADTAGTSRYPAGSFMYIPSSRLRMEALRDGDVLYFVLDEHSKRGQRLRREYGLLVGHQGIAARRGADVDVIHAARDDLPGEYAGDRVVRVPLRTYLERVESFKGVLVTRLDD